MEVCGLNECVRAYVRAYKYVCVCVCVWLCVKYIDIIVYLVPTVSTFGKTTELLNTKLNFPMELSNMYCKIISHTQGKKMEVKKVIFFLFFVIRHQTKKMYSN